MGYGGLYRRNLPLILHNTLLMDYADYIYINRHYADIMVVYGLRLILPTTELNQRKLATESTFQ